MNSDLREVIAQWYLATFAERTSRLAAGEVNIDWAVPEYRVSWTEVVAQAAALGFDVSNPSLVDLRTWLSARLPGPLRGDVPPEDPR